jgi:hypothetical protein
MRQSRRQNDTSPDTSAVYAWLSRDADGIEGIIAAPIGDVIFPLVFTDCERAQKFRGSAEFAAALRGYPAALVKFVRAETIHETSG